jgi:hypothetical protein
MVLLKTRYSTNWDWKPVIWAFINRVKLLEVVGTLGIALFTTRRLRRLIDGIFDPPSTNGDMLWSILEYQNPCIFYKMPWFQASGRSMWS